MVDLYYGNGVDEAVVPQYGEFKWGIESFDSDLTHDELNLNGKRWRYDVEDRSSDHSRSVDDFDDIFLNALLDDPGAYSWKKRQVRSERKEDESVEVSEIDDEGCVLQDLEIVMVQQLSEKTRICFRDALYRLANINTQQLGLESESNMNIDRAVANLMFNEMEYPSSACQKDTTLTCSGDAQVPV